MHLRFSLSLLLIAGTGLTQTAQQSVPGPGVTIAKNSRLDIADNDLEAANKTNPDDVRITGRLLQYLARENRDPDWSARFALLSWNVQHHPDASFFAMNLAYTGMPDGLRAQLKQLWIAEVHQHADDATILRNASVAMSPPFPSLSAGIRVGGNVQASNLITKVEPEYPPLARQAGVQGLVKFNVTIDKEGRVATITLASGHPLLVQAAVSAVQQYRYRPTLLNGQPVAVTTTVDVSFTL